MNRTWTERPAAARYPCHILFRHARKQSDIVQTDPFFSPATRTRAFKRGMRTGCLGIQAPLHRPCSSILSPPRIQFCITTPNPNDTFGPKNRILKSARPTRPVPFDASLLKFEKLKILSRGVTRRTGRVEWDESSGTDRLHSYSMFLFTSRYLKWHLRGSSTLEGLVI